MRTMTDEERKAWEQRVSIVTEKVTIGVLAVTAISLIFWGLWLIYFPLCPLFVGFLILGSLLVPDKPGRRKGRP
jgi:hypothetical protein